MILKFDDYIKESLWKKGIERSKTGEKRNEELSEFDTYLKNINWIDLGNKEYLFEEFSYPETLSLDEIRNIINSLPNDISILGMSELDWLVNNCVISENDESVIFTGKKGKTIEFVNSKYDIAYFSKFRFNNSNNEHFYYQTGRYGTVTQAVPHFNTKMISRCVWSEKQNYKELIKLIKRK